MLGFKTNKEIDEEKYAEIREEINTEEATGLSGFLNRRFQEARSAKIRIEEDLLKALRQRKGEYEPDKLAEIQSLGGSQIYMQLTSVKCRAAENWIFEVMFPPGERNFSLKATPIPEISPDVAEAMEEELMLQAAEAMQIDPTMVIMPEEVESVAEELKERLLDKFREDAAERAKKMEDLIEDQFAEAGFRQVLKEHIKDVVTFRAGILKGPVFLRKRVLEYKRINGRMIPHISTKVIPFYQRVSPFDIYPSPNSRGIQDGYLFERHKLTVKSLIEMKGVEGYRGDVIDEIIENYGQKGKRNWLLNDQERANLESRNNEFLTAEGTIDVLEYSGGVIGKDLIDWGLNVEDPTRYYEANVWFVGHYIFKAVLNDDPLGQRPYSKSCFEEIPGSFWGWGVPDLMRDTQDMCNGAARALANNMALSSGPQVEVNRSRLSTHEDIEGVSPWKIWFTKTDEFGSNEPAIRFHDVPNNAYLLMQVYDFYSRLADDHTGIPAYTYGNAKVGGAGRTSSGLSMLMTAASRGIKGVIANIDRTLIEVVKRTYDYNMRFHPDESVKGDVNIVASGSKSLIAKEQQQIRKTEFLAATNNPVDNQIMGLEGRAELLRDILATMDVNVDKIIPETPGNMPMQGAVPMQAPQTLDAAGNPVQGQDYNLFGGNNG